MAAPCLLCYGGQVVVQLVVQVLAHLLEVFLLLRRLPAHSFDVLLLGGGLELALWLD